MSYQIEGKICQIGMTQQVSEKFKKREFVLEISDEVNGQVYKSYAKMQLMQAKVGLLDSYAIGDTVNASFNVKGNKWERDGVVNYITNLDCWKIEKVGVTNPTAGIGTPSYGNAPQNTLDDDNSGLPF